MSFRTPIATMRAFLRDRRGVSFLEFALALPVFMALFLSGAEVANYVTTKMRMSQLALHVADHTARIGAGSLLAAKTISEKQVNDVLTGAGVQADKLNLYSNGRVIVSSLEPDPANSGKYKIVWQRCRGIKNVTSSYGVQGASNLSGMGPTNQVVTAPASGQTIYVELYYEYQPIIQSRYAPATSMRETAAMPVRDTRATTNSVTVLTNTEAAPAHTCNLFTTT